MLAFYKTIFHPKKLYCEMEKFQNKYRIPSARLQNWNYSWAAAYFITICTKDRVPFFGKITDGEMVLSPTGVLADIFWYEIKNHAQNVELGEFVVMPNHMHGILILKGDGNSGDGDVETRHALSLHPHHPQTIGQQRFQNQGKNTLSSIIGSYKSAVTKHANRLKLPNGWQARFHDHIIRDAQSFHNISNYIVKNPHNWEKDKFFGNR